MFDGNDQFQQFIASSRSTTTTTSSSLSNFPLFHGNHTYFLPGFDPYRSSYHHQELYHQSQPPNNKIINQEDVVVDHPSWSNDEVLLLLKLRSSMENWFPDFSWEHISRKFAELGIKRSSEQCKEKFEEESHHHSNTSYKRINFSELDEIYSCENQEERKQMEKPNEEDQIQKISAEVSKEMVTKSVKPIKKRKRKDEKFDTLKCYCEAIVNKMMAQQEEMNNKLIEEIVKRDEEMIAREEEWKNQVMDKTKLELEKSAKEQANVEERQSIILEFLKKFTYENDQKHPPGSYIEAASEDTMLSIRTPPACNSVLTRTLEHIIRAQEFSPNSSISLCSEIPNESTLLPGTTPSTYNPVLTPILEHVIISQELAPNSSLALCCEISPGSTQLSSKTPPTCNFLITPTLETLTQDNLEAIPMLSNTVLPHENPSSLATQTTSKPPKTHSPPSSGSNIPTTKYLEPNSSSSNPTSFGSKFDKNGDNGMRWPRDQVLALINLRCKLSNTSNNDESTKGPLWERISRGMLELGFKRNAKRCKEKWENINKYFRKTKDSNKKRSIDSRTCPYFEQLSRLYNEGTFVLMNEQKTSSRAA